MERSRHHREMEINRRDALAFKIDHGDFTRQNRASIMMSEAEQARGQGTGPDGGMAIRLGGRHSLEDVAVYPVRIIRYISSRLTMRDD